MFAAEDLKILAKPQSIIDRSVNVARGHSVADAKDAIAAIATEMSGEKITIETRVAAADATPAGRRSGDKPAPLRDDPVLSAFRKHLGGELVKEKR